MDAEASSEGVGGRLRRGARAIAAGAIAGAVCGAIFGGIGGRIAMRLVALASPTPPLFDRSASLQLLLQVAYRGVAVGIVFVAIRKWLPKWRWGMEFEFGALLIGLMLVAALSPWRAEFRQGPLLLGLALFALVIGFFGVATAWLSVQLERWWVIHLGDGPVQTITVGLVALLGLVAGLIGLLSIIVKDLISGS